MALDLAIMILAKNELRAPAAYDSPPFRGEAGSWILLGLQGRGWG